MRAFRLDGKRVLVTGGSKGIGLGIARGVTEAGADVVLIARNRSDLDAARATLTDLGCNAKTVSFDLQRVDEIDVLYQRVLEVAGPCDVLVNCAGINRRGPAQDLSLEDWNAVLNLNLTSVFALSKAFARERIASGRRGKIINIASLTSEATRPNIAAYTASKGGIKQLTKALAVDWAPYGINVNAIGPGYIRTPLTQPLWEDPEFDAWVKKRTPAGRWGLPEDLAYTAVFLASEASDFITGQVIYVDGGWLAAF